MSARPSCRPGEPLCEGGRCVQRVKGWVENRAWQAGAPAGTRYITSMFLVLKSDVAHTDLEQLFGVVAEVVVGMIFGMIAGQFSSMLVSARASKQKYLAKMSELAEFMRASALPAPLRAKLVLFYEHVYQGQTVFDQRAIISELPPPIRKDLMGELYGELVRAVPLFKGLDEEVTAGLGRIVAFC
jgi:hypothetical protein